jgi:STE24 endopeptidase
MNDWNFMALLILLGLFGLWKLELVASLLNLKAFPDRVPPELDGVMDQAQLARAADYLKANVRIQILQGSVSLGVLLVFWALGGFNWLDQLTRAWTGGPLTAGLLFLGLMFLGQSLIALPFSIYDTFVIEQRFGFNRSTPATFVADRVKGLVLAAVLGLPLLAGILWIFNEVPNAWLWAWLMVTGFQLLLTYIAPSWIMPLFNKFTPMAEGELKESIQKLGEKCGFPLDGVFMMDGSKRSTKANAFFTGLGKRKKIALFDTLMEKHGREELLAILAHEIGHFRRGHIRQRLVVGIFQTAVIFYLLGLATDPGGVFAKHLHAAFGVERVSPQVGLVLFGILLEPVNRLLGMLANAWSRRHEFEADAYAAEVTGSAAPLGEALKRLSADHLSHPAPCKLRVWLDYSHPPLIERLRALGARS